MPSHSVKQAKVMSAIAHGWHPSGLDIPVKVARDFHAADAGHKYGKGMDKKAKALSATKHYRKKARGGSIEGDGKDDVSYGGTLPRSLQPITTQIPDSWMRRPNPQRYADGGDIPDVGEPMIPSGGEFSPGTALGNKAADIGSKIGGNAAIGSATLFPRYIKSIVDAAQYPAGSEEAREAYGDVGQTTGEMGMSMIGPKGGRPVAGTSGVFVGPYGAHMLRAADREAGRPTKPHPVVEAEIAAKAATLRPEFRDIYKGQVQDMRDAEARAALEARQGSLNAPKSDRDIWARSGWHRGSEGMIKKEIPDTGAKLVKNPDGGYKLEHPAGDLHEIYDIPPIIFDASIAKGNASFDDVTNQIKLGGKPTKENLESSVGSALHEFQHAIQKKEGFAYGSNIYRSKARPESEQEFFPLDPYGMNIRTDTKPSYLNRAAVPSWHQSMAEKQKGYGEDPESEISAYRRAVFEAYRRTAGETEARNVSDRWKNNSYLQHPEDTEDITRGLQYIEGRMMPRKRSDIKIGGKEFPEDFPTYRETKAGGGGVAGNFNPERGAAFGLTRQGMIKSTVPGRTDKLNLNVPSGSYVIPADIPSALGQGNTTAGGAILDRMFNKGPYGMNLPRARGGSRVGQRKSSLSKQSFAEGGEVGQVTPILAAGGEYMIHPETVANLGNGDMDLGHSILDSFVKQVRAKHINTLKNLKPPKGSE